MERYSNFESIQSNECIEDVRVIKAMNANIEVRVSRNECFEDVKAFNLMMHRRCEISQGRKNYSYNYCS